MISIRINRYLEVRCYFDQSIATANVNIMATCINNHDIFPIQQLKYDECRKIVASQHCHHLCAHKCTYIKSKTTFNVWIEIIISG